ncbi:IclR family transcriptional regulator [Halocatena halophila]|uniref:IclR family transcriptional regulator n=1 Tax=Halocatena halophila TaxID=2814576 RepID=UPI002ED59498
MAEKITGRQLKTTQTSLAILRLILEHDGLTLAEIDEFVDSSKPSICSHLNTLCEHRYVVKDDGVYRVSYRLALLGRRSSRRYPSMDAVSSVVDELATTTGQEANFTIFEHGRLLLFYGASSDEDAVEGYRSEYYLHNTAAGKAILAALDSERGEAIIDRWGLPREAPATITSRSELVATLAEIRGDGHAIVDEEFAPGLVSVGAPVYATDGSILGGLSVGGPKFRIDMTRLDTDIASTLHDAVDTLESVL